MLVYSQRRQLVISYYEWLETVQTSAKLDTESLETFTAFLVSEKLLDEKKVKEYFEKGNTSK